MTQRRTKQQIKLFAGNLLETCTNEWLSKHPEVEVVSISICDGPNGHCILIHYRESV